MEKTAAALLTFRGILYTVSITNKEPSMSSALSNFKANLVKGKQCIFTAKWCPVPTLRTIVEVRSKDVSFTNPSLGKAPSWLNFPKKDEVSEPTPNKFIIAFSDSDQVPLTYDFNLPTA